jgi:hypothetical protein
MVILSIQTAYFKITNLLHYMKKILLVIIASGFSCSLFAQRVHKMPPRPNGELYVPKISTIVNPGDTIMLAGNYKIINLNEVNGTAEKPIIIYADKPVNVGAGANNYGIIIQGRHWKFLGNGHTKVHNREYSLNILFGFGGSADFTIDGVALQHGHVGFFGNPDKGGIRRNIVISNSTVTQLRGTRTGGRSEGIYLGATNLNNMDSAGYKNVLISNCEFNDLDGDGIQVAVSQNVIIRNCVVANYGKANVNFQNIGILVGGSSQATIENVEIRNGSGTAIQLYGVKHNIIRNTTISNTSKALNADAIYIEKKSNMPEALTVEMTDVQIDGAGRNGIRNVNATSVKLTRVNILKANAGKTFGKNFTTVR